MERIKTLETRSLCDSAKNGGCGLECTGHVREGCLTHKNGGCGECQTSCQSACKTSCGVANQKCENNK